MSFHRSITKISGLLALHLGQFLSPPLRRRVGEGKLDPTFYLKGAEGEKKEVVFEIPSNSASYYTFSKSLT